MSILVLFLLLGVAYTKHISNYDNNNPTEPIITRTEERRICAELCMSGLGGEPCGDTCLDIIPQGLLGRSSQSTTNLNNASNVVNHIKTTKTATILKKNYTTRHSACPILCKNQLGYPLCECNLNELVMHKKPFYQVDYFGICSYFCVEFNYKIYGCPDCTILKKLNTSEDVVQTKSDEGTIDWNAWCNQRCHEGEGGAACNCDLLPMLFKVNNE